MTCDDLKAYIAANFGDKMAPLDSGKFDPFYRIEAGNLLNLCQQLRDDDNLKFDFLCNLGGTDTGTNFEIVYSLASIALSHRIDFKIIMPYENAAIDSIQSIWPGANWYEREMWELYGIHVRNHDNLKRFLLPDDWDQGYPMRKNWSAPDFIKLPEVLT